MVVAVHVTIHMAVHVVIPVVVHRAIHGAIGVVIRAILRLRAGGKAGGGHGQPGQRDNDLRLHNCLPFAPLVLGARPFYARQPERQVNSPHPSDAFDTFLALPCEFQRTGNYSSPLRVKSKRILTQVPILA